MEYTKPEIMTSYAVIDLYTSASGFASTPTCTGSFDDNGIGANCDDGGSYG